MTNSNEITMQLTNHLENIPTEALVNITAEALFRLGELEAIIKSTNLSGKEKITLLSNKLKDYDHVAYLSYRYGEGTRFIEKNISESNEDRDVLNIFDLIPKHTYWVANGKVEADKKQDFDKETNVGLAY